MLSGCTTYLHTFVIGICQLSCITLGVSARDFEDTAEFPTHHSRGRHQTVPAPPYMGTHAWVIECWIAGNTEQVAETC